MSGEERADRAPGGCGSVAEALAALLKWPAAPLEPTEDPFLPSVPGRGFLIADYRLDSLQLEALRRVATRRGDKGLLLQALTTDMDGRLTDDCVEVYWDDPSTWTRDPEFALECAVIDIGRSWCIWFTDEWYAIVGGPIEFVAELLAELKTTSHDGIAEWLLDEPPTNERELVANIHWTA